MFFMKNLLTDFQALERNKTREQLEISTKKYYK